MLRPVEKIVGLGVGVDVGVDVKVDAEVRMSFQDLVTASNTLKEIGAKAGEDGKIIATQITASVDLAMQRFESLQLWQLRSSLHFYHHELKSLVGKIRVVGKAYTLP
ncbi:hypothetical protein EON65_54325 [archaeon]|nr:MAG: hypothetical protein EON65_54325 [archaeon]